MIYKICNRAAKIPRINTGILKIYNSSHLVDEKDRRIRCTEWEHIFREKYKATESTTYWQEKIGGKRGTDLSVIIPFYKTERYAKRCIESVCNQKTEYKFEIIMVDGGSPDECGHILDKYTELANVTVIHQQNAGLSAARNAGLLVASGEYILFLDSDDVLLPDALNSLLSVAKKYNADIVEGGHYTFDERGIRKKYNHQFSVAEHGAGMYGYAWGKVIRASLFNTICFPEGYWYEDTIISSLIYPNAGTTICIPQLVVGYFINKKGITAQTNCSIKCIDTLSIIDLILREYTLRGQRPSESLQHGILYQLGPYLFFRTKGLGRDMQIAVFLKAAEVAEEFGILDIVSESYYENELINALMHRQFKRWKWASILM